MPEPAYGPEYDLTTTDVMDRLIEAYVTLRRMPAGRLGPTSYGNAWPEMREEWSDLVSRLKSPDSTQKGRSSSPLPPPNQVSRMEEALEWPMKFLPDRPNDRMFIINYAAARSAKMPVKSIAHVLGITRQHLLRVRKRKLTVLTRRINRHWRRGN